ncbi:MAG: phosphoribosylaminoimidazolesuccinocarboxamide synthase [Candidatus Altiarchaeota archaeon]
MENIVLETNLPYPKFKKGKVREVYDLDEHLLIVASDRISAFDVVLPNGIPDKGKVLTQLSLYWFKQIGDLVGNHVITADIKDYPDNLQEHAETLKGRSMLVKKADVIPIECVSRGYLAGSGWKDYQKTGMVCGIELPSGMRESEELPEPIYTPATKADTGHDINISFSEMKDVVDEGTAEKLRDLTLSIYSKAAGEARGKGIIIADTKFEFGFFEDELILVDEALTPDSSRFWPADSYNPGGPQKSFDKQYVRDFLETLDWDKSPPGPELPAEVVSGTRKRYLEAYKKITGKDLV